MLIDIMNDHGFERMAHFPTLDENIVDLILITEPGQLRYIHYLEKLIDHDVMSGTFRNLLDPFKEIEKKGVFVQKGKFETMRKGVLKFAQRKLLKWLCRFSISPGKVRHFNVFYTKSKR